MQQKTHINNTEYFFFLLYSLLPTEQFLSIRETEDFLNVG